MATYVKGSPVANATSYELSEKAADGTYSVLATGAEINFEVSALGLAIGDHTLVVKAKADSYTDSDYSNEVVYNVPSAGYTTTLTANSGAKSYIIKSDGSTMSGGTYGNLEYDLTAGMGGTLNIHTEYSAPSTGQYVDVVVWALFSGSISSDTLLTPTGADIHEGITDFVVDLNQYPTATKLRVLGIKSTMATTGTTVQHISD